MKDFFQFAEKLIWPLVLIFISTRFRQELKLILSRLTSISFGNNKVELGAIDKARIKTAEEIRSSTNSPKEQAEQLIEKNAISIGEFRILRGLVSEPRGRSFSVHTKSSYYSLAVASLRAKYLLDKKDGIYFLTSTGLELTKLHIMTFLSVI